MPPVRLVRDHRVELEEDTCKHSLVVFLPLQVARAAVRERHLSTRRLVLTAVREGSGQLVLREIEDRDLGVLFEHWTNPDAIRMAAFTSPDQNDRAAFERRHG